MSMLLKELQAEAERREAAFSAKLSRLGRDDLAAEYADIITLRNAVEVMGKKSRSGRSYRVNGSDAASGPSSDANLMQNGNGTDMPEGFILSDAVRNAIRHIKAERFRASTVFRFLQIEYPFYIHQDKRRSISATLSNLVNYGELSREIDSQRKVWYRVVRLRDTGPQPELLPE
jgi:hypothetical protein